MRPAKVVAVILALIPASAQAAPFSWDNPGGGNFNNFLNWSPIGVPGATDTAAFDELGNYIVTLDGDFTNQSATIDTAVTVGFVPDIAAGRTYTLTGDLSIQGSDLFLGSPGFPMHLDIGDDLKIGSGGDIFINNSNTVTTVDLQVGSLASGGEGSVLVFAASSIDVTGANTTILGANSFSGVVQVTAGTMSIAGPLELATDSDPGTNGTLSASSNGSVKLGDVEIGGGSSTSAGAFTLSTGGTIDLSGAATLILGGVTGTGTGTITLIDDSQMTTGTGLTTILETGLVDLDDTATFTANGDLLVDDGRIEGELNAQLLHGPGTTTTVQNGGAIDLMGNWSIRGSGGSRDVVIEADGDVDVDFALNLGTSGDSAANFTMNGGNVQVGPIVVGSQGNFNFVGGILAVANVIVSGGQFTTASDFDFVLADVSVSGNGVITVGGTATIATTLTVNGGSFIADDFGTIPNPFTFTSGLVQLNNGLTIGNADVFGSNFTITQNHQLKTAVATTIDPFSTLTLDGGLLETGTFVNNGTFDFSGERCALPVVVV